MASFTYGLNTITNRTIGELEKTIDELKSLLKYKNEEIMKLNQIIENQTTRITTLSQTVVRLSPVYDHELGKLVYPKPGSDLRY